jgi:VWFA-related protein
MRSFGHGVLTAIVAALIFASVGAAEPDGTAMAGASTAAATTPPAAGSGERKLDDATIERLLKLQETEQVTVRLVLVPATVEDRKGRIVRGLSAEDFRLADNNVPQRIQYFSIEGAEPVAIAFLLDVSGSMRQIGKLEAAKEAIRYFVDALRPQDRFALIAFADEQVSWITEFTSDRQRFLDRLSVQEGYGQTALLDAVAATPKLVDESATGRKAIVLITDGVDNASRLTIEQAVSLARQVEVPIYTVGFSTLAEVAQDKRQLAQGMSLLRKFSSETGGEFFMVRDPDDLKETVARINTELRYQYLIGYKPDLAAWDGRYRTIRLETRSSRYQVRTRAGYYARP